MFLKEANMEKISYFCSPHLYIMRRFVLFIACLAAVVASHAESLYSFRSLTTADGLSSSTVKCMLVDSNGFLWIGTDM